MRRPVRQAAGVVAIVVAAMAIGRVVTDHADEETLAKPFVRHGVLGKTVHLRYADVRVTGVRVAARMDGADAVDPAGRFLIVDLTYRAKGEPRRFLGLELHDAHGRRFAPTTRGASCPQNLEGVTGVPMYAMACFDVPRSALADSYFRFSLGDYGVNGSGQRRDDLADVDLGITARQADRMWSEDLTYAADSSVSTRPLDKLPVTLEKPSWWDELR